MPRSGISVIAQDEPAFLKKFKEKINYKEEPGVDAKRQKLPEEEEDERDDRNDEQPVVVVLKDGDMTAEEAEKFQKQHERKELHGSEEECSSSDGKIIFKKPVKRTMEDDSDLFVQSSKQMKNEKKKKEKCPTAKASIKNSSLLSFEEDDYDDT